VLTKKRKMDLERKHQRSGSRGEERPTTGSPFARTSPPKQEGGDMSRESGYEGCSVRLRKRSIRRDYGSNFLSRSGWQDVRGSLGKKVESRCTCFS